MASAADRESAPLLAGRREADETLTDWTGATSFNADGDRENPLEWTPSFKRLIVFLLSMSAFTVTFSCVSVVPVARRISRDLGGSPGDTSSEALLVTIWELGEAAGPLLIGSLSELFGRAPVLNTANVVFVLALALGALAPTLRFLTFTRVLTGAAVAINVLGPAIIGDIFVPEQRGTAMSMILFAPLLGSSIGPAFSGAAIETLSWRVIVLVSVVLAAVCYSISFVFFRETYTPAILRRRAAKLIAANPTSDTDKPASRHTYESLWLSIARPVTVLVSSGVLMAISAYIAVMFSHFYVAAITMPRILEDIYHLSPTATGFAFFSNALGSFIGIMVCRSWLDAIYVKLRDNNNGVGLPEYRLPIAIFGAITIVPGVALYGWCAEYNWSIYVFLITCVWVRMSLIMSFAPLTAYVVDACGLYSASALTAVIVIRCLAGAFLPLAIDKLVNALGYGRGFTAYALATFAAISVPVALFYRGENWRRKSEYTRVEEHVEAESTI
ncbi:putative transporter [Beauveria bassiana]|uniref:MFS multidrug transporter n=1 Tax=Beauveria bassiana (strain ARSEF 2860) TaxID=655819 RepID=J4KPV9_BEAB2|nr:MFS multidrug transporter [Beauveria bassiana ARSEF 2860]EJP68134.1 MFS multidrug transporter [Beauveria bassiana ARSEF 2860]KAF1729778.1 putative transporter [Beauveria bassiana]KAH8713725.1 Efflux pump vrtL [Beauveria bassiana]